MRNRTLHIMLAAALAVTAAGCSDELERPGTSYSDVIGFQASVAEGFLPDTDAKKTRGCVSTESFRLSDPSDPDYTLYCHPEAISFGEAVSSIASPRSTRASLTTQASEIESMGIYARANWDTKGLVINNLQYARNASGVYQSTGETLYWPGDAEKSIDFFSYTPWGATGLDMNGVTSTSMTASYTVPVDPTKQVDLMLDVEKNIPGNYNNALPITYSHMLTAVKVNVTSLPTGATAESVTLTNIAYIGTLDMDADPLRWHVDGSQRTSFTAPVVDGSALFLLMPQEITSLSADLQITITEGTQSRTLSGKIPAATWTMGSGVAFNISVSDYGLEFTNTDRVVDAHFVIYKTDVDASAIPSHLEWTLTASDGATIQYEADANTFAKQGYWTDRVERDGTVTTESARGTSSITGQGGTTKSILVFVPENTGTADRSITFTMTINGETKLQEGLTLTQKYPYGEHKWEQIDDNELGIYGFSWNRKTALILPYNVPGSEYTRAQAEALIDNLITQYNASAYASRSYYSSGFLQRRYYVLIDYSKLNDLTTAMSATNGYANTIGLLNKIGKGGANTFENALLNTFKTESGHESEALFRYPVSSDPSSVRNLVTGVNNVDSGILNYVLKKNRCYLSIVTQATAETLTPVYKAEELVWYLPAYSQFSAISSGILDAITPSDYWSSTAANNGTESYTGDGATAPRTSSHKIRAARL